MPTCIFPGSATANYFDLIWGQNGGSDADATHAIDRVKSARVPQLHHQDRLQHALSVAEQRHVDVDQRRLLRTSTAGRSRSARCFSKGYSFDVNYTLSHSQDNGGAPESGGGSAGAIMLNPYDYDSFYGDSDFDIRHNLNANVLFELPFGRGKALLGDAGDLVRHRRRLAGLEASSATARACRPRSPTAASGRPTSRFTTSPTRSAPTTTT